MNLMDPVKGLPIVKAARGGECTHGGIFDLRVFI